MTRLRAALLASLLTACGSGSTADAGYVNPDTVKPIDVSQWEGLVDAGTISYLVELGKAKRCESADLDGDGVRETLCVRSPDGTQTWIQENNGAVPDYKIEHFADGRVLFTYWYQNYSAPVILDEEFPDGHRVTLFDWNHDLKFERRIDESPDGGDIEATEYLDAGPSDAGPGGFVVSRRWVRPAARDQGQVPMCNGTANFPTVTGWWQGGSPPEFAVVDKVACTATQQQKLAAAFECAKTKLKCVGRVNETVKKQVEAHLLDDDLRYGCNNPCGDALATTLPSVFGSKAETNFNGTRLNGWTADQTCSTVLHELMHMAKVEEGGNHPDGTDRIYSCARYCTGCIDFGGVFGGMDPPFPSDNLDCVRCAETATEKAKCGIKKELKAGPCSTLALCHGGIGINKACTGCENLVTNDCEGTQLRSPELNCCTQCPPDALTNDKVCPGPFQPSDTCMSKPPECP
jgi:hypothetical protein